MSSGCATSVFALMILCSAAAGRWHDVNDAFSVTYCISSELLIKTTFSSCKNVGQLKFIFMSIYVYIK